MTKAFNLGRDEQYQFDIYGLTYEGRAVCVEDYCVKLANNESTHVIMFQDRNQTDHQMVRETDIDWKVPFNELQLVQRKGLKRFMSYKSTSQVITRQLQDIQKKK